MRHEGMSRKLVVAVVAVGAKPAGLLDDDRSYLDLSAEIDSEHEIAASGL